jgi:hypothetical protein
MAPRETSDAMCPLTSPVIAIQEWSRISDTTLSGTPLEVSIMLAAKCRRCVQPGVRDPCPRASTLSARRALLGSQGSPVWVVNTTPVVRRAGRPVAASRAAVSAGTSSLRSGDRGRFSRAQEPQPLDETAITRLTLDYR